MGLFRSWSKNRSAAIAAFFCLVSPALAIQVPAGTEINLRLKTKVASSSSKMKDPVEAIVIQPVMAGGQFVIPAGAVVHGVVIEAKALHRPRRSRHARYRLQPVGSPRRQSEAGEHGLRRR